MSFPIEAPGRTKQPPRDWLSAAGQSSLTVQFSAIFPFIAFALKRL